MLKGDKKKQYQKEYMRRKRSNEAGSNKKRGLTPEGLTDVIESLPKKTVTPVEKPTLFGSSWEAQEARDRILSGYGKKVQ